MFTSFLSKWLCFEKPYNFGMLLPFVIVDKFLLELMEDIASSSYMAHFSNKFLLPSLIVCVCVFWINSETTDSRMMHCIFNKNVFKIKGKN